MSYNKIYPFGMPLPGRQYNAGDYRYGFNGKELDDASNGMGGGGNTYDYGFRIYNPQIAKFLSVDPLTSSYPMLTPYQFASNTPIQAIDVDGLEAIMATALMKAKATEPELSLQESLDVFSVISTMIFKLGFSSDLPKKLIDHYAYGKGEPIVLSEQEMIDANIYKTGLQGANLRPSDITNFQSTLKSIGKGERKDVTIKVLSGAGTSGTLGRFTIIFEGVLSKSKDGSWNFEGTMQVKELWDFNVDEEATKGTATRSESGQTLVEFANEYLKGDAFEITSEKIPVTQSSGESSVSYFDDKNPVGVPNRAVEYGLTKKLKTDVKK